MKYEAPTFSRKDTFDRIEPRLVGLPVRLGKSKSKLVKLSNNSHGNLDGSLLTSWTVGTKFVDSASPKSHSP